LYFLDTWRMNLMLYFRITSSFWAFGENPLLCCSQLFHSWLLFPLFVFPPPPPSAQKGTASGHVREKSRASPLIPSPPVSSPEQVVFARVTVLTTGSMKFFFFGLKFRNTCFFFPTIGMFCGTFGTGSFLDCPPLGVPCSGWC